MSREIDVVVNGHVRRCPEGQTIALLVADLGLDARRVAVERNKVLVRRGAWDDTALEPNDQIEIVEFVGGG